MNIFLHLIALFALTTSLTNDLSASAEDFKRSRDDDSEEEQPLKRLRADDSASSSGDDGAGEPSSAAAASSSDAAAASTLVSLASAVAAPLAHKKSLQCPHCLWLRRSLASIPTQY